MVNTLDIALDERFNRRGYGGGRGGRSGWNMARGRSGMFRERATAMRRGGPLRATVRSSPFKIAKSFSRARNIIWQNDLLNDSMEAAGFSAAQAGTKLYISNLDYRVSNDDIKELFSEVGQLKRSTVHYDRNGRPSGSAEVIFVRRSDAISAFKKYNNVQLDGKAMKIEIIGENNGLPVSARVNVVGISKGGAERRTVSMIPKLGQAGGSQFNRFPRSNRGRGGPLAGRGGFQATYGGRGGFQANRGRGGFQSGRGRGSYQTRGGRRNSRGRGKKSTDKSADQLDKELESYHAEAMNTS